MAAETEEHMADMAADEAMTRRALGLLGSQRNDAYEAALAALRENTQAWLGGQACRDPRAAGPEGEVLPRFENRRKELANRLISEICSGPMAADIESVASEPHDALIAPAGRAFCLDCVV